MQKENLIRNKIALKCTRWQKENQKIGFTSGSFDLLHAGHVSYLEEAKKKCDKLIVAINTNQSIKNYKSSFRPIIDEQQRIHLLQSLKFIDEVFLFDELNNKENILALKPNFYFKAQDYSEKKLTSAKYLEQWGGEVILLPLLQGISTTKIIDKIQNQKKDLQKNKKNSDEDFLQKLHFQISDTQNTKLKKVIFLDRDGVLNKEVEYLHQVEKLEILPNVISGLKKMQQFGYTFVVVTTQAGIGLGYFRKEDFFKVNKKMLSVFYQNDILIHKIYFCPCSKIENCNCRKPKIGLIERAQQDINIDMSVSFFIGDKTSDILAGKNAKLKTILVETGHAGKDQEFDVIPDYKVVDLLEAAKIVCGD